MAFYKFAFVYLALNLAKKGVKNRARMKAYNIL